MPQTVKFSIKTAFTEGGPKIPEVVRTNKVSANMVVMEELQNDKDWYDFDVLGGSREDIQFMMIAADRYDDEHCPREDDPGILFRFSEDDDFSLLLDGPLLYSGHTISCLPNRVDKIWIQNRMTDKVKFYLILGRKPRKKKKGTTQANGQAAQQAKPQAALQQQN